MSPDRLLRRTCLCAVPLFALALTACRSIALPPHPAPAPLPPAPPPPSRENFRVVFEDGFTLDYQLERKISEIDGKSCYFFLTGTLLNQSMRTLSKESVLDFQAMNQGKQAYRDIANPVTHIAPGARAMFWLLASPVFREGCPSYERIRVSLRKVFLD